MPGTVTVACKLPNGLEIRTFVEEIRLVNVIGGGTRDVKMFRPSGWSHKLNGPARKIGQDVGYPIVHGFGLTHGVDADRYAEWLEQHKDTDLVKNGLIFANVKPTEVVAQANDHKSIKTGLEPVDPHNLPDEFKRKIEPATPS